MEVLYSLRQSSLISLYLLRDAQIKRKFMKFVKYVVHELVIGRSEGDGCTRKGAKIGFFLLQGFLSFFLFG